MIFGLTSTLAMVLNLNKSVQFPIAPQNHILASQQMSLDYRYAVPSVNKVFKDNILLNMAYMEQTPIDPAHVDWTEIEKPFHYEFTLKPGQSFAFHDDFLPQFQGSVVKTTNAHFGPQEGFVSDGYLYGDGVCHLASLIDYAATSANLSVVAPTNHNFAVIPEINKKYGVAIYDAPGSHSANAQENLYVTNNQSKDVTFAFDYQNDNLKVTVLEQD